MTRPVAVVPHTHWDREWYEPFASFRLRLVEVLDGLLALLEEDPSFRHFLLDGQMAMVDDYLQVRPEAEEQIRSLALAGRLTLGPWYVLMDEFLVSGETIVRNLQLGMERAGQLGGAMEVGYLPDMFGHVAQMPQILAAAGMAHAVVWRGVPAAIDRSAFWWQAPDGSTVRAEYLPAGYGNGAAIPEEADILVRRVRDHLSEVGPFLLDGLLFMNGSDHQAPQPWLGRVIATANATQDDLAFTVTSLPEYLHSAPTGALASWRGELRSGARANLLMGVTSTRVDVKQAAAATQRALERRAEPYGALFDARERRSEHLLALAWRQVVRNAAHDSICACSIDEVVDAVLGRFTDARALSDGLARRSLGDLASSLAAPGVTVVNPCARDRHGLVEVMVAGEEAPAHSQVLEERPGALGIPRSSGTLTLDATTVRSILGFLPSGTRIDDHTSIHQVSVSEDPTGIDVCVSLGPGERPDAEVASARQDLYARLSARPDAVVRIRLDQPPMHRIVARVGPVPGFGWQQLRVVPAEHPVCVLVPTEPPGALCLQNDLVTVAIDPTSGTFAIDAVAGFGQLVDGGDHGDAYNYSPPATDRFVAHPETVDVALDEAGPLRATVVVTACYRWPDHVDGTTGARVGEQPVTVTTVVEVRADDPVVRVRSSFVNPCRDHRVRIHLPLPQRALSSHAECAFTVVERGLYGEGRPDELAMATFPSRRFVQAGGLTVVHDAIHEYELVDIDPDAGGAGTLALTALRATGMLSRLGMTYRPLPAGPLVAVPGQQLLGATVTARYALCLGEVDPFAMADDVLVPLDVVHAPGGGWRPATGQVLSVRGAEVSALRRRSAHLELRVFNPTDTPTTVDLAQRTGWLVDLRGRPQAPVAGSLRLEPQQIATLHLADPPAR